MFALAKHSCYTIINMY